MTACAMRVRTRIEFYGCLALQVLEGSDELQGHPFLIQSHSWI